MSSAGHVPVVAYDGPTALAAATTTRPAVALLDIGLPVMDGYELARPLRALPGLDRLVLIAVTGYGQEQDRAKTREAGFAAHLVKPIEPTGLATALNAIRASIAGLAAESTRSVSRRFARVL